MGRSQIPNTLTIARLFMSVVLFVVLGLFDPSSVDATNHWLLVGIVLFVAASITDALDGYLARKWQVESRFGRIVDPMADKVLVLGAMMYLAGPRFVDVESALRGQPNWMLSGVYPWMVVVMLVRELLVTAIRGALEAQGTKFGAKTSGKLKMIFQCVVVPAVLLIVYIEPQRTGYAWLTYVRDLLVYAAVLATVASGLPYVTAAFRLLDTPDQGGTESA